MSNKNVLITGAASGIGAATVTSYLERTGYHIIAADRNAQALQALKENLAPDQKMRLTTIEIDFTKSQSIVDLMNHSSLDHVIISHGIAYENSITDDQLWDQIISINFLSVQRLFSSISELIHEDGRVVIVSSILGRVGKANNSAYVSSKHALLGLTKSLALDWAPRKITVNAVLPCWVDTPMLYEELKPQADALGVPIEKIIRTIKKRIPLRQLVTPKQVSESILFLTSPAASMITAQSIVIDGGYSCGI